MALARPMRRVVAHCLCTALLKLWPAWWTFVTVPGVEPTNNTAERAIRPPVLWRRSSFGTQSAGRSQFATRLLSVGAPCQQQERSLLDYLTAVCTPPSRAIPPPRSYPLPQPSLRRRKRLLRMKASRTISSAWSCATCAVMTWLSCVSNCSRLPSDFGISVPSSKPASNSAVMRFRAPRKDQ